MLRKLFIFVLIISVPLVLAAAAVGLWGYYYFTRDLPNLKSIQDYNPPAVSSVFAADGTLIAEFYKERRYPARLDEVPQLVRNCFLAAEDANFYNHPGIDPISIVRALVKNVRAGGVKQGGSTITQQVVKNLLLTDERKLQRKVKEAILSYRLEQRLSKDGILEMYLNQIFFGNTAYGIKAAARLYFGKELADLNLAEAAMLAGLPKAPSRYSPLSSMVRAKRRQKYVLNQMVKAGFATREQADEAYALELNPRRASAENFYKAPYFASEVRRVFQDRWRDINLDTAGLEIHTTLDLEADEFATAALRRGLKEVDKRRGWRGPLATLSATDIKQKYEEQFAAQVPETLREGEVYPALVQEVSRSAGSISVQVGRHPAVLNVKDAPWSRRFLDPDERVRAVEPQQLLRRGDVIEVSLPAQPADQKKGSEEPFPTAHDSAVKVVLDQSPGAPHIEGAVMILDPHSGRVAAMVGGYDYSRSQFNRVTQSLRQPGSAFKPVVYLAAVDGFGYTPATIVHDEPRTFRVGDEYWTPANFDKKFMGPIPLRMALEKSKNLVSADIISRIGIDPVIHYAKILGITSKLGRNLSLSLGSSEVTPLELTRAYGVFAARGMLFDSTLIARIVGRDGSLIFDADTERISSATQAINERSAFIMANMMKGVVERGTATRVKALGRPAAGKTGTSNDQMDTWFIGYTPQWVCGVWVGFDLKKEIGDKETGGRVAAPIWLYAMDPFLKHEDQRNYEKLVEETRAEAERLGIEYVPPEPLQPLDFSVPDGVEPFWVDRFSGRLSDQSNPEAILEYFVRGTEPKFSADQEDLSSYLNSPEL